MRHSTDALRKRSLLLCPAGEAPELSDQIVNGGDLQLNGKDHIRRKKLRNSRKHHSEAFRGHGVCC